MRKIGLLLLLFLTYSGLRSQDNHVAVIDMKVPFGDNFVNSPLFDSVSFFGLETDRPYDLNEKLDMKVEGDNYFVLDTRRTRCVYRFNSEGKLLNLICNEKAASKYENTPELTNPPRFSVDPFKKKVEIYNYEDDEISRFNYDGDLIGRFKLNFAPSDFLRLENGLYWYYTGWNNSETQFRLIQTDQKGNILRKTMRLISQCMPVEGDAMSYYGDNILLWEILGTHTYRIEGEDLIKTFRFNFGDYNLPITYHNQPGYEMFLKIRKNGYYALKKYLENDKFAYFFFNYEDEQRKEMLHIIYDKETGESHKLMENAGIKAFNKAHALTDNNELIFLISSRNMRRALLPSSGSIPIMFDEIKNEIFRIRYPIVMKIKLKS